MFNFFFYSTNLLRGDRLGIFIHFVSTERAIDDHKHGIT